MNRHVLTSAVTDTLPKYASDKLNVWRVDCIPTPYG